MDGTTVSSKILCVFSDAFHFIIEAKIIAHRMIKMEEQKMHSCISLKYVIVSGDPGNVAA